MGEGVGFGLLGGDSKIRTADYKSAGSHQKEINKFQAPAVTAWTEIHTVTTGKTFYCSVIRISSLTEHIAYIGTGSAGSEVQIFGSVVNSSNPVNLELETPIIFTTGTRITVSLSSANTTYFTLIGWEE